MIVTLNENHKLLDRILGYRKEPTYYCVDIKFVNIDSNPITITLTSPLGHTVQRQSTHDIDFSLYDVGLWEYKIECEGYSTKYGSYQVNQYDFGRKIDIDVEYILIEEEE